MPQDFSTDMQAAYDAIAAGRHGDPFAVLGLHPSPRGLTLTTFEPGAAGGAVVDAKGKKVADLERVHDAGVFVARMPRRKSRFAYRLRFEGEGGAWERGDPYAHGPWMGDLDRHLLGEGSHERIWTVLGAHPCTHEGAKGVAFAVWAPNARRVSVVGPFVHWDGRRLPMRNRGGFWEIFVPDITAGEVYKYEILGEAGDLRPLKADPVGFRHQIAPDTASVVSALPGAPASRGPSTGREQPVSIYEVHLGSWRRGDGDRVLSYADMGPMLAEYASEMGFTHVEFLPVTEHPFGGSWGYQPIGLYAPLSRLGTPEEFKAMVETLHGAGLGVIADWVPAHFPSDSHGLARFDGTHLYEHADPRQGFHKDWNTLIFNYGRTEVANYLRGSALFWLEEYGVDALRVDAVASMLYLDYSRSAGEWVPNHEGGRENFEAIEFLKRTNIGVGAMEGRAAIAEESTAWPGVTRPVDAGGLGFHYKWNMGWMNDTLEYMKEDPVNRRHHHHKMTFGIDYAFSENYVLPLSHDEVVHGKGSLLGRMPGDEWQRFANLRAYLGFMWGHPGKKLLFMGGEFGQAREWNHDRSLDWHLLEQGNHKGVQDLVRDLNRLYRETPALHARDCEAEGFQWIDGGAMDDNVLSFLRLAPGEAPVAVICNFAPVVREGYAVGLPSGGRWKELLNTDDVRYAGSGQANDGFDASGEGHQGQPHSARLTLPPLGTIFLTPA